MVKIFLIILSCYLIVFLILSGVYSRVFPGFMTCDDFITHDNALCACDFQYFQNLFVLISNTILVDVLPMKTKLL